ncbi:PP2C family protein-serine/threonine phosphatase [Streptomyces sp. NPDC055099]
MDHLPSAPGTRARLELGAIRELLQSQRRRIGSYAREQHAGQHPSPRGTPPPDTPSPPAPTAQQLLDALPSPALLLAPVLDTDGEVVDVTYVTQNEAAVTYAAERLPEGAVPRWSGPVSLYAHYPSLLCTAIPEMIARAQRDRVPQGPEAIEWIADGTAGPARINDAVRIAPCGDQLLLTWERGHSGLMATAAQRLVRTCWAEWNLGDDGIKPSLGFRQVLGLPKDATLPTLSALAGTVTVDSLPGLYQMLYDVILRKRTADCELRPIGVGDRIIRMTAEPVRIRPGGLVWAIRAVLTDVTAELRRRETAARAEREARRQRQRAQTLGEVADALRDAVLPHFQDELAAYGLQAAAVYRPDAREAGIGGDWYKARGLPDGRLLVALGDARGHGLAAVTLMAKLRYALAGLAYTEQPVEQLTQWLNETACADGIESTATAIIASYHPEQSILRWTCAGHPRPVLMRDGRAAQMPLPAGGPGLPLGVLPGTSYTAATTELRIGDIVLMYSDGLTERRDSDPDRDTRRFLAAAEQSCRTTAPTAGRDGLNRYVEQVVALLDGPHRSDDATLLALRHEA